MSLMYLAYTPADELPVDEKYALATDMALAALTGEGVYNFGEVIATPVLAVLQGSPNQYLYDLVIALNQGNIDVFNSVVDSNKESYFAQDVLKNCHDQVQQKVVLLSLMNVVFELPSHERTISFTTIANVSKVPLEQVCILVHCVPCWTLFIHVICLLLFCCFCCQVDWILMRAMSLGLIKGSINEVDQNVNVTWVQPRVLNTVEMSTISTQLGDWVERYSLATMVDSFMLYC